MKVEFLYSQGTSPVREDGIVVTASLFGVLDGVSSPYSPKNLPRKSGGLTGGEMVVRFVEHAAHTNSPKNLRQFVLEMNKKIGEIQRGVLPGKLAGAVFAFALVKGDRLEVIQAGDCFIVVETKKGEVIVSPNQVRRHDEEMNSEISRLMREISFEFFHLPLKSLSETQLNEVREEMWKQFYDIIVEARRQDNNNPASPRGFGILNGDPRLAQMIWEKYFRISNISTVLLFTDGMVPWVEMKNMSDEQVAQEVLAEFKKEEGLAGLLISARKAEKKTISHISHAEASGVAITF